MSRLDSVTEDELKALNGKTIIISGGVSGIGRSAVYLAHAAGANVAVADISEDAGKELATELKGRIIFVPTDVSKWNSVLELFQKVYERFHGIDVVLANAGVNNVDDLFDDVFDGTGSLAAPSLKNVEVNLHGAIYFTRAAIHFFKKTPERKCQLVLTGSAASLIETPPLYLYCASKAGVLGLMRATRKRMPSGNVTVNMVAPWMTVTAMMPEWIRQTWEGLPANDCPGVAKALLLPAVRPGINGKTLWVAGNDVIEIEDGIDATRPRWMGEELSAKLDEGQRRMGI